MKSPTQHMWLTFCKVTECWFRTTIDDVGAEHAGLGSLTEHKSDIVKLDMELIRAIDNELAKRAVVEHMLRMLDDLGITPMYERIEIYAEALALAELGVNLIQGFYLAKPGFQQLPVLVSYRPFSSAS